MGNVCSCCSWGRVNSNAKDGKSKKLDEKDVWFEQDSVPLVSARYGLDDIGSDEADGSLKRKVLIRSPRPTSISPSDAIERSSRTSRHLQQQHEQEERQYPIHRGKSASVDSSIYSSRRSRRGGEEERTRSHSGRRHRHSRHGDDSDDRDRRIARSTSLEAQDSTHEMRSPSSSSIRSPRAASSSQDAASFADDEVESADSSHGSTRSHRSSSNASSSPKASSKSGSPHKKQRYGRKHYRANANRK
ncbi:hypothetical protein JG687_00003837 [Phytophthora cactorum]|uniref:Uncharacterized protein n=1 Tax=Phytophthora cactorum TaxID=29920 RepID=A0A329S6U4_9STRA|nr:hypothetical protein Pcac1_g19409 [Phytophthora cactorum]KAG2869510.1 hypothetical protein PC113_g67 [Phytophthora cactorum]KAG2935873.1 hypothetical protein PC114_g386 [Phytophthora cactorum]KAG3035852.1 hypothetical protein PC120_g570 [Phytophthora cactorum]KAG3105649.1 hypothetical protein PC121_g353 [Phytophthora cactorum]